MNEFTRSLLLVLIASAVSTSSYGMGHAVLIGEEDAKRMETVTPAAAPVITTVVLQPTPEGSRSPLEGVLPGEVKRAASPAPREKSVLETTVRHGDSSVAPSGADAAAHSNAGLIVAQPLPRAEAGTPPPASPERVDSPASSSDSDREYVSAAEGGSGIRKNVSDSELAKQRTAATADEFAQVRVQRGKGAVAEKHASREASAEIPAAAGAKKTASNSGLTHERSATPPVEDAMLRSKDEKSFTPSAASVLPSTKLDSAAGVGLPAPEARAASPERKPIPASMPAATDSFSHSFSPAPAVGVRSAAAPDPLLDPVYLPLPQKDSLLAKIKRNKLKIFAVILALVETADFAQAYFLKTTKDELKDKTLTEKAKLITQKTYTAALLGAAKDTALNLKQHFKTFLHKKN